MMPGFRTYVDYVYLKKHFKDFEWIWNPNANYTRLKVSSFEKRKDRIFFQKLEKVIADRDARIECLVSAFLFNNEIWIGDIFDSEVSQFHNDRVKRVSGLESLFHSDVEKIEFYLIDKRLTLQSILLTSATKSPILVQDAQTLGVSFETLTVINHFTNFTDVWFPLHPLLKIRRLQLHKYKYLLHIANNRYDRLHNSFQNLAHISA
jgi:hypothetical protein